MTPDADPDYGESELRERFPRVVQGKAQKATALHLPDPDADNPEPMCDRASNGWRRVDVAAFPEGYRDFCHYCKCELREKDQEEDRPEPTPTAQRWESCGDALAADW